MVIVWLFSVIFAYATSSIAMEEPVELIAPTTPRLWVQSLADQKKNKDNSSVSNREQRNKKYKEMLDGYIDLIAKQEPREQLKHYLTMIKAELEKKNEDSELITSLCERLAQVYNDYFYNTAYEQETAKYISKLKKTLKSKNNYKDTLKFLRFSRTGALPPLPQEDNLQPARKQSFSDSNNKIPTIPLKNHDTTFMKISGKECRAFGTDHTVKALTFFENKILTMTSDGSLVIYNYETGREVHRNEDAKNKKPLAIIESLVESKNKDLKVAKLCSDCRSIIFYGSEDCHLRCILPTNDLLIVSNNQSGELIGERFSKKKKMRYEKHGQVVTALYAVNKSRFLSGYQDGVVKCWNIKTKKCIKIIELEHEINDFAKFDENLICLCGLHYLCLLMLGEQRSTCLYSSKEEIKKIFEFYDFLVAGLKNGSLRLWRKNLGFNKTALLHLKNSEHFYKFAVHGQDLFCCYKDGAVIKLPYSFLSKAFEHAIDHDFNSESNAISVVEISSQ